MSRSSTGEPMSGADAAWLHMDTATNNAIILGVFTLSAPIELDVLKATLWERVIARHLRFRQRIVEPHLGVGRPRWELDPQFDLHRHVRAIALPRPANKEALQELVGRLMNVPFDPGHPLWEIYYVDNYQRGAAMVARLHHCIADGIALAYVMLGLADPGPGMPQRITVAPATRRSDHLAMPGALHTATTAMRSVTGTSRQMWHEGLESLVRPEHARELASQGTRAARALAKLLLIPPDRDTLLRTPCTGLKRAAWSTPLALADVKSAGRVTGGTVNDVLLTAVAGGLGRYLRGRGEDTDGLEIRAIVPVNLRPPAETGELGNRFGLVFLTLPVGIEDTVERLRALKQHMDAIKDSPEAVVAFGILGVIGHTPVEAEAIIVKIFGLKASGVMTNVPGPREPMYLCGVPIEDILFWVPQPAGLALGVSIMSYNGRVILGIASDVAAVPDPEAILRACEVEFADMLELVRLVEADRPPLPERCQGHTRSGKRCRRHPLPGQAYCRLHARQAEPAT